MSSLQFDFLDIRTLNDSQYEQAFAAMSASRQQRAQRMRHEDDLRRTIAADHLARRMAAKRFGIEPEAVALDRLESGQPVLTGLPCCISLSHSGSWVMCALCDRPVGADIEVIIPRGQRLLKWACTAEEQAYILASGQFDPLRFMQVWTAKEAVLKRSGQGLSGGIDTTVVANADGLLPVISGCTLISGLHEDAVYSVIY